MDEYELKRNVLQLKQSQLLVAVTSYIKRKRRIYQEYLSSQEGFLKNLSLEGSEGTSSASKNYALEKLEITAEEETLAEAQYREKDQGLGPRLFCLGTIGSTPEDISDGEILAGIKEARKLPQDKKSFASKLNEYMLAKNLEPVEIYKPLGMTRQHFSKLFNGKGYHPRKDTVIALGMALKLNFTELEDLLARADYGINPNSDFDSVIEYLVKKHFYDLERIDMLLEKLNLPTICKYE